MKYQREDLSKFPEQIRYALQNYEPHGLDLNNYRQIVLCGLGGSGIAGRIVKSYFYDSMTVPVEVISDYDLPAYVGPDTLTIQCSYSGNTEETLAMYQDAKSRGAAIISMATGGQIESLTHADGYPFYRAVAGFQPRMALGYSLTYLLLIFSELLGRDIRSELEAAAESLTDEETFISRGRELVQAWGDPNRKTIVVADYFTNPVGVRFCQQLQENAKAEAFVHELPEANHNVIETYYGKLDSNFLFLNSHRNERTSLRFSFLQELLERNGNNIQNIHVEADSLSNILQTIYILDWVSLLSAEARNVNSAQIPNINSLKKFLAENEQVMTGN